MNEKNLINIGERTTNEQREITSKGGRASGAARRKKKALKDCMKQLLALPVTDCEKRNELAALGIDPEDIDNNMLVTVGLFKAAAGGNAKAYHEMRHLISDNETDLDRKLKRAQLDKIKAETEAIKCQNNNNDTVDEDSHRSLVDALDQSTANVWEVEIENEN